MNSAEIYVQIIFLLSALYIEEHLPIPPLKTLRFPNSQSQRCYPVPVVHITTCCVLFLLPFCLPLPVWSCGFIFTLFYLYFFIFFMSFYLILIIWQSDFMSPLLPFFQIHPNPLLPNSFLRLAVQLPHTKFFTCHLQQLFWALRCSLEVVQNVNRCHYTFKTQSLCTVVTEP